MSEILTRDAKGYPLSHREVDRNFTNLNAAVVDASGAAISAGESAVAAAASASTAAGSASAAAASAVLAADYATDSQDAAGESTASAAAALDSLNTFKGAWYGPLAADPTVDPLGDPINAGDAYFNTVLPGMKTYDGAVWSAVDNQIELATVDGSGLIGWDQAIAGAIPRTVRDKLRETVSYKDVGAVGDGVADDAAALVATYAGTSHVVVSPGTYRILSNVVMSKATTFRAGAKIVVPTGVTLTIGADIIAGKHQVIEVEAGGDVQITSGALSQIIPQWFGLNVWYGGSNAVYGTRAGEKLLKATGPTTANYISAFGYRAAEQMTIGLEGAFFGTFAGSSLTDGTFQSAFGFGALRGKESSPGSGVFNPMAGQNNTAVGAYAIQDASTANRVTAVGVGAVRNNDTPTDIVAVGAQVFRLGTVGKENTGFGSSCGYYFGTTGVEASSIRNLFGGYNSAGNATEGTFNTMLGAMSGFYCSNPVQNTYLGYNTGPLSATYSSVTKTICVGVNARTQADNTITIGNGITETVAGRVRIGTSAEQTSVMLGPKKLSIGDSGGVDITVGTGSPEGVVTAVAGSLFLRTGGNDGPLYTKKTGSGNTGWVDAVQVVGATARGVPRYRTATTININAPRNLPMAGFRFMGSYLKGRTPLFSSASNGVAQVNLATDLAAESAAHIDGWYAVFATANHGDASYSLKLMPFLRVASVAGSVATLNSGKEGVHSVIATTYDWSAANNLVTSDILVISETVDGRANTFSGRVATCSANNTTSITLGTIGGVGVDDWLLPSPPGVDEYCYLCSFYYESPGSVRNIGDSGGLVKAKMTNISDPAFPTTGAQVALVLLHVGGYIPPLATAVVLREVATFAVATISDYASYFATDTSLHTVEQTYFSKETATTMTVVKSGIVVPFAFGQNFAWNTAGGLAASRSGGRMDIEGWIEP